MKKNWALVLMVVVTTGVALKAAFADESSETRTSHNGHVFVRDKSFPQLGEAWRDEDGLIWGDVPLRPNGNLVETNYAGARRTCTWSDARLPTAKEFAKLAVKLGATSVIDGDTRGPVTLLGEQTIYKEHRYQMPDRVDFFYKPEGYHLQEILPNLDRQFWTGSEFDRIVYSFDGGRGHFRSEYPEQVNNMYYKLAVRCVVDTKK